MIVRPKTPSIGAILSVSREIQMLGAATALTLSLAFLPGPASGQEARVTSAPVVQAQSPAVIATEEFAIGDRLRIAFFEKYTTIADETDKTAFATLVERPEMTGEYVIQQDGAVFLPLVGTAAAAGMTGNQLEKVLAERFKQTFDGEVAVAIQLLEREPIYVTGAIPQSGTFRFVPGMRVLHALALAGGIDRTGVDLWRQFDLAREQERVRQSENRLERYFARMIVLSAERGTTDDARRRLDELTGRATADHLIKQAERVRKLERSKLDAERQANDTILNTLADELRILQESMRDTEANMKEKAERVTVMLQLRERGATTDHNVHIARSELSDARARWNDLRATQTRVERNIAEVHQQLVRLEMDGHIAVESEMGTLAFSIREEETTRSTLAQLFVNIQNPETRPGGRGHKAFDLEIVRRRPGGTETLPCNISTEMRPGDVLQIIPRSREQETARM